MEEIDMKTAAKLLQLTTRQTEMLFDTGELRGWRIPGSNDRRTTDRAVLAYARLREFTEPLGLS